MPTHRVGKDSFIHPYWASVVAPSLYRSHPTVHDTRKIKITQPTTLTKSDSSTSVLLTPADSPGNIWGTGQSGFFASRNPSPVKKDDQSSGSASRDIVVVNRSQTTDGSPTSSDSSISVPVFPRLDRFVSTAKCICTRVQRELTCQGIIVPPTMASRGIIAHSHPLLRSPMETHVP